MPDEQRDATASLITNVAVLTEAVRDLKTELQRIREQSVTQVEFKALSDTVKSHSAIFGRLAWIVVATVLVAVLTLVVQSGGLQS